MSIAEPHANYVIQSAGFGEAIHIWHELGHAICGATEANHTCGDANGDWRYAKPGDTDCETCHKPLCVYCRLLLGWKI